ncbi:MAG TPA: DUF5686 family protein, partial [Puia sp.]|nr:DUF5686 family protein [Puia sp.]
MSGKFAPIPRTLQIVFLLAAGLLWKTGTGQNRAVIGTVLDSISRQPIPGASITTPDSHHGVLTDQKGQFHIVVGYRVRHLVVSATGYRQLTVSARDEGEPLIILLSKNFTLLQDVVVRSKPGKYRNKNNPAVELIRKVIANKSKNAPEADAYESYSEYEKTRLLLDNVPHVITDNTLLKKYHFLFGNTDTTILPGHTLIPFYIEEVSSQQYRRKHPDTDKKMVLGHKSVDFGEYLDMKGISAGVNRLFEDIDIYDNTIEAFTMQFTSPVADLAPTFYMYFIRDTVVIDSELLVELYFTPRNPEDLLFRGTLYITLDGNYAVRRAELGVSRHINLNYTREFRIDLDFQKDSSTGRWHLAVSDMLALLSPLPKSMGLVGQRIVRFGRFSTNPLPDSLFSGAAIDSSGLAEVRTDSFWTAGRPVPLSITEARTYANTDSLVRMRSYHRLMDYTTAFTAGYKSVGKFDMGPIGSFWTFNPVEGQRLKFGGRTTTRLNNRWFGESYVAYGFKDRRWKYFVSATYAFNHKSIYTYPLHFVQVSWLDDARALGQENAFAVANNFFTSFSHGDNSKWLYNRVLRVTYIRELASHLSWSFGMKYWRQQPTGSLYYIYMNQADQADTVRQLTTGEASVTLRWAPHEQFLQNKSGRYNIVNRYPIITLQYGKGIEGLFGGEFNYDALHLRVYKRCYISPAGYSDVSLDAGWLSGNLPFPLLVIHPGNPSYFYSQGAYNMMNVGEFVSDHYAGLNIDHFFNGFFFNKIPGLKRLRLREVVAGKILYGGLNDQNNPAVNPGQMKFPTTGGVTSTYALGGKPYIEGSV